MKRLATLALAALVLMGAGARITWMNLSSWSMGGFVPSWTDADGVRCLSDEDTYAASWTADSFTGTFTTTVYLCPVNPNAPTGAANMDIHALAGANSGSFTLSITQPDGSIVKMRPLDRKSSEVCIVRDWLDRQPGIYTITFTGLKANAPSLIVRVNMTRPPLDAGGWDGCQLGWWTT